VGVGVVEDISVGKEYYIIKLPFLPSIFGTAHAHDGTCT